MRGAIAGLPAPHRLEERLPGVMREDGFVVRLTQGLDGVLAPVLTTLDCLDAYLDPALTPEDFLHWLAGWVAIELGEAWTPAQRRAIVASAVDLHRWRGTKHGLAQQVALITGGEVEVDDGGGCAWSTEPGTAPPGPATRNVKITVRTAQAVDVARLRAFVSGSVPAHVTFSIEVVPS